MKLKFLENMNKKTMIKCGVALVVGVILGVLVVPMCSDENHEGIDKKIIVLENLVEDKEKEVETLNKKVIEAKPWFEMNSEEQRKIEEENARIEEEAKAQKEAEQKAKEEDEAQKQREEEEAKKKEEQQGYNTGITYKQLARDEQEYWYKKVTFKGKVLQVQEGSEENVIRLAVDGNYDNILLVRHIKPRVGDRILENDWITVRGIFNGLESYTSVMGAEITLPTVLCDDKNIDR
ncbi:MAG: toxin regulator [Romboutsia sp.]|uniref:toxin regulator n=1 Tax=Romboutsia sp. TaxID=1965302 RepID=UPI003F3F2A10